MYLALKKEEVPAELHVYAIGRPRLRPAQSDKPCSQWPRPLRRVDEVAGAPQDGPEMNTDDTDKHGSFNPSYPFIRGSIFRPRNFLDSLRPLILRLVAEQVPGRRAS